MQLLPKSPCLLVYETKHISQGYLSVNTLLENFDIHILEASPIAPGRLMVLANPIAEDLRKAFTMIRTQYRKHLVDIAMMEQMQKETLLAFYALNQTPLQDMLLVIETPSVASALNIVNGLKVQNLIAPIEVRSSRSLAGKSLVYATLTKSCQSEVETFLALQKPIHDFDFALISSNHAYWRTFF